LVVDRDTDPVAAGYGWALRSSFRIVARFLRICDHALKCGFELQFVALCCAFQMEKAIQRPSIWQAENVAFIRFFQTNNRTQKIKLPEGGVCHMDTDGVVLYRQIDIVSHQMCRIFKASQPHCVLYFSMIAACT
jgi:hypothetical protein